MYMSHVGRTVMRTVKILAAASATARVGACTSDLFFLSACCACASDLAPDSLRTYMSPLVKQAGGSCPVLCVAGLDDDGRQGTLVTWKQQEREKSTRKTVALGDSSV
jgi:hypothetical protein